MSTRSVQTLRRHPPPTSQMTIRNVPPDLDRALRVEQGRRGSSLNRTVLDLLRQALGLGVGRRFDNGLRRLAGSWTADDLKNMEENTNVFEQVDPEVWS